MTQSLTCGVIFFCVFGTAVSLCQGLSDSRDVAKTDGRDVMKTRSREIYDMCDLGKLFCVCYVCIQEQSFNNFENKTMKLSVNKAKLTGFWARNHAIIQLVWILKFALGPKK